MTSAGRKAYNIKKFVVNRDIAPGKVFSIKWIPCEKRHVEPVPVEILKPPAKKKIMNYFLEQEG